MTDELPLFMQNNDYPARLVRALFDYDEGVATPTSFKVTQRAAGAAMSVDVGAGTAYVQGDDQAEQGIYRCRRTSLVNVAVTAAPGSNSRYDLVVLKINDPDATGAAGNNFTVAVVAGTASATPAVPAVPVSALPLAVIGPIATSTSAITTSLIHDVWSGTGPAFATSCRLLAGEKGTVGELKMFAGSATVNGWLYCDGRAISRTTYADLFVIIGSSYGAGDGSTTFNVPDLRNRVPVAGGGSFGTVGAVGGEVTHLLTGAESGVANHDHGTYTNVQTADHYHVFSGSTGFESGTHTHNVKSASGTYQPVVAFTGSGQNDGVNTLVLDGYPSGSGQRLNTDTQSSNHTHGFSGSTGGISANHQHQINATGNVNASTAHNNMPPYQVISGYLIRT